MSEKIQILFPTDFSELTADVFPTALHVARTYEADVYVQATIELPAGPFKMFSSFDEQGARKEASAMLDRFIATHGDPSLTYHKVIKVGKPFKQIVQTAEEFNMNAIVMATHGAHGAKELFIGSNASKVVSTAPCPIITLQGAQETAGFKKILLPLDLTKETGEKLQLAIEFATNFSASLVVLSVLETSDEDAKKRLQRRMNQAVAHVRSQEIEVDSTMLITKGRVADVVIEYGNEIGADLICIMTQQELDFKQTFLGSNAGHLVNHSNVPVLSIKPTKQYRSKVYSGSHFG
ncbi:MAG: universal stress protein [Bacteroidota bacterium]